MLVTHSISRKSGK